MILISNRKSIKCMINVTTINNNACFISITPTHMSLMSIVRVTSKNNKFPGKLINF